MSGRRARAAAAGDLAACARSHMKIGWWSLLLFLVLGAALESMHGFKVGWYLDGGNEARRLMWTLAHAHGTLVAILHIVFGLTAARLEGWSLRARTIASRCLTASIVLLPGGFFAGGVQILAGDPGPGVLLVPVGAALLFLAVWLTARAV